jgi:hypothetical protein
MKTLLILLDGKGKAIIHTDAKHDASFLKQINNRTLELSEHPTSHEVMKKH